MTKPTKPAKAFRFRRFARAGWAAFRSMHREVTIGRLAVKVADSSMAKSGLLCAAALLLVPAAAPAQSEKESETRQLAEVQIALSADSLMGSPEPVAVVTAETIRQHPIHSLADLVSLLPGVEARVRGVGDAQSDLTMRGGTFDQIVLLVNGINLTDAQTGHHTMDIPIDIGMVQRVELLAPAQLMARGIAAFCGGVNIVVAEEYADRLAAEFSSGSYGTGNASVLATRQSGAWSLTAAGSYHRSEGYRENSDYRHGSLFVQAVRHGERDDLHLQAGMQAKEFGSAGFYSTTYPDQFETTRTLTGSAEYTRHGGKVVSHHSVYGRLHRDRFELFRDGYAVAPAWYTGHNHHLSSTAGLRSRGIMPIGHGEVLAGLDIKREGIWSNVLGKADTLLQAPYTRSDVRAGATLFGGWHLAAGRWNLQAVGLGLIHSRFGVNYGVSADAIYRPSRQAAYRLSVSRTYRLPTFTDLYYQSAVQQANPDLGAECSYSADAGVTYELGVVGCDLQCYYRAGRDIIDWVRRPEAEMWYSMNHTVVDAYGMDAAVRVDLSPVKLSAGYSYCSVDADAEGWVSGSALEYLRHRAAVRVRWAVTKRLTVGGGCVYRMREGEWVDTDGAVRLYGGVLLADAMAEYATGKVTFFVEGSNLSGSEYRDHGGVPMPGRTVMFGIRIGDRGN